jgi:hypothetical protein
VSVSGLRFERDFLRTNGSAKNETENFGKNSFKELVFFSWKTQSEKIQPMGHRWAALIRISYLNSVLYRWEPKHVANKKLL